MCKLPSSWPPVRVEVGSEQRFLTPLPRVTAGNRGQPRDPEENSERLDFVRRRGRSATLACDDPPKTSPRTSGRPTAAQGAPKGPHRCFKTAIGTPKGGQRGPKAPQREPKGAQRDPKWSSIGIHRVSKNEKQWACENYSSRKTSSHLKNKL